MHWRRLKAEILAHGGARPEGVPDRWRDRSTAGPGARGPGSYFFATDAGRVRVAVNPDSPLSLKVADDGTAVITGPDMQVKGWLEKVALHCPRQAYITLSEGCIFGCRYCAVPSGPGRYKTADDVETLVRTVLDRIDAISITSGVLGSVAADEARALVVVERVMQFGIPVGVSIYPTRETPRRLHDLGVAEVKFNVETATADLFAEMCPGLEYELIWEVLRESVALFGRNRVFSNVILGLGETDDEMAACIRRLTEMGVIPVIRPLTPAAGVAHLPRPGADRILHIADIQEEALAQAGLDPSQARTMCSACTGCDLVPGVDL
ncbi:radical SAM protein [Methanomicrobiaceae archaeon CYW5]|uniref:radical SAM protein n=1 Tax=Methanovulcanius yangii TaxID=1789227 RepID=UPI0029CA51A1|nr:radical SAM protein [Methanovulcanius yangii]MBT8508104.1 radical SAM protein [Methanovulcanius yangii]